MTDREMREEYSVFTNKAILKAVELMISKNDIRNQRGLCERMLQFYGFPRADIVETLQNGQYADGVARSRLGVVAVK